MTASERREPVELAAAEVERLRRVNGEWGLVMSTLIDGLAERGVPTPLGGRYTQAALDEVDRLREQVRVEQATNQRLREAVDRLLDAWYGRYVEDVTEPGRAAWKAAMDDLTAAALAAAEAAEPSEGNGT